MPGALHDRAAPAVPPERPARFVVREELEETAPTGRRSSVPGSSRRWTGGRLGPHRRARVSRSDPGQRPGRGSADRPPSALPAAAAPPEGGGVGARGAHHAALRAAGLAAGLDVVEVATAEPFVEVRRTLERRKAEGLHGGMAFTYRHPARSTDPRSRCPTPRRSSSGARGYLVDGADAADGGPRGSGRPLRLGRPLRRCSRTA